MEPDASPTVVIPAGILQPAETLSLATDQVDCPFGVVFEGTARGKSGTRDIWGQINWNTDTHPLRVASAGEGQRAVSVCTMTWDDIPGASESGLAAIIDMHYCLFSFDFMMRLWAREAEAEDELIKISEGSQCFQRTEIFSISRMLDD